MVDSGLALGSAGSVWSHLLFFTASLLVPIRDG